MLRGNVLCHDKKTPHKPSLLLVRVCFIKKKTSVLLPLHPSSHPPPLPKLAVHSEFFCLWLHHLPLKEVLWFWSRGCWSVRPVPFRPVWSDSSWEGYIHWQVPAGADLTVTWSIVSRRRPAGASALVVSPAGWSPWFSSVQSAGQEHNQTHSEIMINAN